jgi:choloylglycine hydrolase
MERRDSDPEEIVRTLRRIVVGLLALGQILGSVSIASACTGIRLKAKDGAVIYARTMEFAADLRSELIVIPRGKEYVGSAPGGRRGMRWTTRYGVAGANAFGMPIVVDGLNEKGLAVGIFYFPGYAGYPAVSESEAETTLAPHELATYLLGTCGDVGEAIQAARRVKVAGVVVEQLRIVPPVHFVVHDASGRSAVLEHVDGRLTVHDNPLGVVTNAPTFDWHVTNLRNYINLTVTDVPRVDLGGRAFAAFGMGSGLHGLPGDFTPPSRFVRAVAFSRSAEPVESGREGVLQAFHILNQFDIPKGSTRKVEQGEAVADHTLWTAASDLKNLRYHIHTHASRRIRMLDLSRADLEAKVVKTIPIDDEEVVEDVTGKAR